MANKYSDKREKKSLIGGVCAKCKRYAAVFGVGIVIMCSICDISAAVIPVPRNLQIITANNLSEAQTHTATAIPPIKMIPLYTYSSSIEECIKVAAPFQSKSD